jgi:meiotically up-regulated gene 157 (Mug157) protein
MGRSASGGVGRIKEGARWKIALVLGVRLVIPALVAVAVTLSVLLVQKSHQAAGASPHDFLRGSDALTTSARKGLENTIESLRRRLPPSVWTTAGRDADPQVANLVLSGLSREEVEKGRQLCSKFLFSSLQRAVEVQGNQAFVATGDIDDMWTRDGSVQMGLYMGRMTSEPWLRSIVEGSLRRHAFNILQDPYANAYERHWTDPSTLPFKERIIGRGGWVATRNYEVDSGAYFLTSLYDYYVVPGLYRPEVLLQETLIFDAVNLLVDVYIVEQEHDTKSPYRYFELPNNGLGTPTAYTGMTWSGFRPSDDPTKYGYLIPSNIHAAAGLERVMELNQRIWKSESLEQKARKLLADISDGIRKFGVVQSQSDQSSIYAYEVDGMGNSLSGFDDANVPSLLSIPLLGWSGYDPEVYRNTRRIILSKETNSFYFEGEALRGIGSPHTPSEYVWSMGFSIQALTEAGTPQERAASMIFQIRQSLLAACGDAMHESVHVRSGCAARTREWFEWANALFVTLWESSTGERCDAGANKQILQAQVLPATGGKDEGAGEEVYGDPYRNNRRVPLYYQGVSAQVPYEKK